MRMEMRSLPPVAIVLLALLPAAAADARRHASISLIAAGPDASNGPLLATQRARGSREGGSLTHAQPSSDRSKGARASNLVLRCFEHHWTVVTLHSQFVAAVFARGGRHIWAGRGTLADLLIRYRLTAFTSEFGESLRPLMHVWKVRATYAVSWTYVLLDVLLRTGDEVALRGRTWRVLRTLLFFSIFHTVATMLIPAFVIHSAVHSAQHALEVLTPRVPWLEGSHLWWVPTAIGLVLIPLMPLLDAPVEGLLEAGFHRLWRIPPSPDYAAAMRAE